MLTERRAKAIAEDDMEVVQSYNPHSQSAPMTPLTDNQTAHSTINLSRFDSDAESEEDVPSAKINGFTNPKSTKTKKSAKEKTKDKPKATLNSECSSSSRSKKSRQSFPGTKAFAGNGSSSIAVSLPAHSSESSGGNSSSSEDEKSGATICTTQTELPRHTSQPTASVGLPAPTSWSSSSNNSLPTSSEEDSSADDNSNHSSPHKSTNNQLMEKVSPPSVLDSAPSTKSDSSTAPLERPEVGPTDALALLLKSAAESMKGPSDSGGISWDLQDLLPNSSTGNMKQNISMSSNGLAMLLESAANIIRSASKATPQNRQTTTSHLGTPTCSLQPAVLNFTETECFTSSSSESEKEDTLARRVKKTPKSSDSTLVIADEPRQTLVNDSPDSKDKKLTGKLDLVENSSSSSTGDSDSDDSSVPEAALTTQDTLKISSINARKSSVCLAAASDSSGASSDSADDDREDTLVAEPSVLPVDQENVKPKKRPKIKRDKSTKNPTTISAEEKHALSNKKRLEALSKRKQEIRSQQQMINASLGNTVSCFLRCCNVVYLLQGVCNRNH